MGVKQKSVPVSDNVSAELEIDVIDGEELDTRVKLDGEFWVSGSQYREFCQKLGELIDEYRI